MVCHNKTCGGEIYPQNNDVNVELGLSGNGQCPLLGFGYLVSTNVNEEMGLSGTIDCHYASVEGTEPSPLPQTDDEKNYIHKEMDLIDFLKVLGVSKEKADKYYSFMRKFWFENALVEPLFYCVEVIDKDENIIGVFYEDAWRRNRVYLGDVIFSFGESGRLFYLTHEIVHYMDFHGNGKVTLSENETDTKARDILTIGGLW